MKTETKIITKKGVKRGDKYIIPCEYDDIMPAVIDGVESDEIFLTQGENGLGIVKYNSDDESNMYIKNEHYSISDFEKGFANISIYDERFGERFSIVDTNLNIKTEFKYTEINRLSDEFFEVQNHAYHGVIDKDGKEIIPCMYAKINYYPGRGCFEVEL